MDSRVGKRLGNYYLTHLLGSGGFSQVYLGEHIYLKRFVAIKVLSTQVSSKDEQAFLQEGRIIASLEHPNILRVLDFGIDAHVSYLVMEYAPNGTLRRRHPKGSLLPIHTMLPYVQQISAALQYAHDRRLIHCDVKPENMLIGGNGHILLADFGISTILSNTTAKTLQSIVGTIGYMAPEQFDGRIERASDQYALAVVVYEWLCGKKPFQGFTMIDTAMQHLLGQPQPLREIVPALPAAIEAVVMQALAKQPGERFPSIQDFAQALAQASPSTASAVIFCAQVPDGTDRDLKEHSALPAPAGQDESTDKQERKVLQPVPLQGPQAAPGDEKSCTTPSAAEQFVQEPGPHALSAPYAQQPEISASAHCSSAEGSFPPPQPPFSPGFTRQSPQEVQAHPSYPAQQQSVLSASASPHHPFPDFFISYSRVDRARAMWIAACLQEAGYSVLLPPVDFRMGCTFKSEMKKAFAQAKRMLVAFSPAYLVILQSRPASLRTLKRAIVRQQESLLGVCVGDYDALLEELSGIANYIDVTGEDERIARAVLLAYIHGQGITLPSTALPRGLAPVPPLSETQITYAEVFPYPARVSSPSMASTPQTPAGETESERMQTPAPTPGSIEVFFSYSHKDEEMKQELEIHLSNLKRQRVITWHDGEIKAGNIWEEEIEAHLSSAQIILLLVSPDFIASTSCYEKEMLRAIERHRDGKAHVVPIILRPSHWERTPFVNLQALPPGARALTLWPNRDEAFVQVARGVQKLVDSLSESASLAPQQKREGTARSMLSETIAAPEHHPSA